MDEYTGKAEARRVKEEAKIGKPKLRSEIVSRGPHVLALEAENAALRLQLASQQYQPVVFQTVTTNTTNPNSDFEREYNRPETVEDAPKGRKIVLDETSQ